MSFPHVPSLGLARRFGTDGHQAAVRKERGDSKKTEGENGEIKAVPVRERGSCRASDASCLLGHLKVVEYDVVSC